MEVFEWFLIECPFIWIPVCFFLLFSVLLSGVVFLLMFPLIDVFFDKERGASEC